MIVYHYTTKDSFDEIQKSKTIRLSTPWTTMDAAYGTGWYFTDLGPDICDMVVAYNCWMNTTSAALERVEYYLKFDIDSRILKKTREHAYMVPTWDQELIKYLEGEKNKVCSKRPCETCEEAKKYRS